MKNFSDALIEDVADIASVKQFYSSLKNGYINIDAFHKAFDPQIITANLNDIFDTSSGLLKSRGTYGKIKDCQDIDLQRALKKLWAAQYVDNITTKELQAKRDAQADAQAKAIADAKAKKAEADAIAEAERKALEVENQIIANNCKEEAIDQIKQENPDLVNAYRSITGIDISDAVEVIAKCRFGSNRVSFEVKATDSSNYYDFSKADVENISYLAKYIIKVLENNMRVKIETKITETYSNLISKLGLTDNDWTRLYFLDKTTDQIYRYGHWDGEGRDKNKLVIFVEDGNSIHVSDINYQNMPDINNLDLIVIDNLISYSSGRCWSDSTVNTYYKPTVDKSLLKKCGVCFIPYTGGFNKPSMTLISGDQIPEKLKVLGFTKGEQTNFVYDSSD